MSPPSPEQGGQLGARSLLAWGDLEARRRRAMRRGLGRLPGWVWVLLGGVVLAAELWRRMAMAETGRDQLGAARLWIAAVVVAHVTVMYGAPFRLYWRFDSALLARLPIRGGALFYAAVVRGLRASVLATAACAIGAAPLFYFAPTEIGLRHLALAGIGFAGAALLAPAVTLFAGAMVASDKARVLAASVGGEAAIPNTTWLGALPGFAATMITLSIIAASSWAAGAPRTAIGSPVVLLALGFAIPAAVFAAALWAAPRVTGGAVREVAALDQERLAHIEVTAPSRLEAAWASVAVRGLAGQLFDKDVRLARRRYPAPYFVLGVGVLALWIVAAVQPDDLSAWTVALVSGMAAYSVVMARRLLAPPIEHPAFLATLPFAPADVARAKRAQIWLRLLATVGLGAVPAIARATAPLELGAIVIAMTTIAAITGLRSTNLTTRNH